MLAELFNLADEELGPIDVTAFGSGGFRAERDGVFADGDTREEAIRNLLNVVYGQRNTERLFACDCVEHILHHITPRYRFYNLDPKPDARSIEALKIARAYARGLANSADLERAWLNACKVQYYWGDVANNVIAQAVAARLCCEKKINLKMILGQCLEASYSHDPSASVSWPHHKHPCVVREKQWQERRADYYGVSLQD